MQKLTPERLSFGDFTLDLKRGCLRGYAGEIKLRPKSYEVLKYLVQNNGRLISKDELFDTVWPGTAVTDDSLVQCMTEIRAALGDEKQQTIKTVPRRGYIFDREITSNGSAAEAITYVEEAAGVQLVIEETKQTTAANVFIRKPRGTVIALLVFFAVGMAGAAWWFKTTQSRRRTAATPPRLATTWQLQAIELSNLSRTGNIVNCAISPDGDYAVYAMHNEGLQSLWLRQTATESVQQIAAPAKPRYYGVNFSRDGSHILFARAVDETDTVRALYRIPALGGIPEKLLTGLDWCPTFSPQGDQITFVRNSASRNQSVLLIANSDGSGEREVALRPLTEPYTFPAWSPDGQRIAVSAGSTELGEASRVVVAVGVADGVEKTVSAHKWYWIDGVTWLADGSGLIIAGNPKKSLANSQLWLLSCADGEARRITNDSNNYNYPIISRDSKVLIAGRVELQTHLWVAPAGDAARARRLTTGLGDYKDVYWTPDGELLVTAFENDHADIWLWDVWGNPSRQLTASAGTNWGQSMSPDNRYIVFDSDRTGDFHIWRMDSNGGNPMQLTNGGGEKFAKISPNGKSVVYTSFRDWTLWKIPIEGGESSKISEGYARESAVSPDGKWIAYCTFEQNQYRLALMPFAGGPPVKTFDLPSSAAMPQSIRWSPDGRGVLFIASPGGVSNIWEQPVVGGSPRPVTNFTADHIFGYDWSRDGKQLAVVRGAWTSDMVLLRQK